MRKLLFLVFAFVLVSEVTGQEPVIGAWKVRFALVLEDLVVKPVPLHGFRLLSDADSSIAIPGMSGLDGLAEGLVPAGSYRLVSQEAAMVNGVAYSWDVAIYVNEVGVAELDLTNVNATIDSTIANELEATGRKLEDAVVAYRRVRSSVFRVESGAGHGTGFLVDSEAGLVVTNAHVVANQTNASITLDSVTRVPAVILARDQDRDVAILGIAPSFLGALEALPLAQPRATRSIVEAGERVFAIGFPLNQQQVLTTGIVSSVRDGAIISDVNINPGNSGGPMLNYAAVVVGVNTFLNVSGTGPGISGAIVATEIWPVLEEARLSLDTMPPAPAIALPTMPLTTYSLKTLRAHVDTISAKRLKEYRKHDVAKADIAVQTPVTLLLAARAYDEEVSKDRRQRETSAGIDPNVRYSSMQEFRDWYRFASDFLTPVVLLQVSPQVGETTGSMFGSIVASLGGTKAKATYKFKSDVLEVKFFRNGVPIYPIRGGSVPVERYVDEQWVSLKDVANFGSYVLSPLVFAPDTMGTPPSIVIEVVDLKDNGRSHCRELPKKLVAYIWNDFVPFFRDEDPESPVIIADRDRKPKDFGVSILASDSIVTLEPKKSWHSRSSGCTRNSF